MEEVHRLVRRPRGVWQQPGSGDAARARVATRNSSGLLADGRRGRGGRSVWGSVLLRRGHDHGSHRRLCCLCSLALSPACVRLCSCQCEQVVARLARCASLVHARVPLVRHHARGRQCGAHPTAAAAVTAGALPHAHLSAGRGREGRTDARSNRRLGDAGCGRDRFGERVDEGSQGGLRGMGWRRVQGRVTWIAVKVEGRRLSGVVGGGGRSCPCAYVNGRWGKGAGHERIGAVGVVVRARRRS